MSIARDHPLSAPTHHPSFDLICHRRGQRRNHRLLLHSKMKTELYRNRGFFLKTEPKSTDLAKCWTVTTLKMNVGCVMSGGVYICVCTCYSYYRVKRVICQRMSWSDGVKVYVTHIIDPLNFYARIGNGMLRSLCVQHNCSYNQLKVPVLWK